MEDGGVKKLMQTHQPLQHGQRDPPNNINDNGSTLHVNPIQQSLVHGLHADVDVEALRSETKVCGKRRCMAICSRDDLYFRRS